MALLVPHTGAAQPVMAGLLISAVTALTRKGSHLETDPPPAVPGQPTWGEKEVSQRDAGHCMPGGFWGLQGGSVWKVSTTKPDNPSIIPGTHVVK